MAGGKNNGGWGFFWGVVALIGVILWVNAQQSKTEHTTPVKVTDVTHHAPAVVVPLTPIARTPACNYTPPPGVPNLVCDKDGSWKDIPTTIPSGTVVTGHPGYENPSPGDDGTADCSPGQAPVYVGSSDPNGLDGDGDGIGCE